MTNEEIMEDIYGFKITWNAEDLDMYCIDCASTNKDNNLCDEHYDILERKE
jgi:hypothetical protein